MVSKLIQFRIDEEVFRRIKELAEKEGYKSPNLYVKNVIIKQFATEGKDMDANSVNKRLTRLERMVERTNKELGRIGKEVSLLWKTVRMLSEGRQ